MDPITESAPSTNGKAVTADDHHVPGPWLALIVVCFAQFMVVLDATITNVALPTIKNALSITDADLQWVVNSYTLAFGGFLLLGGRASDLLGRRRIFVIGTLLFSVASLLNGLATSSEMLIFCRGLQGIGAALISPAALSVIMTSFAEGSERAKAMSVWSGIAAGGAAFGLLLGGILTELLSWEWIFFINVPIGLLVIAAAYKWVPESHADLGHRRFDFGGAITVTAGLMLLVYTIVGTVEHGFTSGRTLSYAAVSFALLATFLLIESRISAPLVRLALLRVRSLAVANSAMLMVTAGMFAFFYFATLYVQTVLGYQPIKAGAAFLPFTVGIGIGAGFSQAMVSRIGVKAVGAIGLVLSTVALVYMAATIKVDGTYLMLLWGIIPLSIGMGSTFVPLTLVGTTNVSDDEAGLASGVFNTSQQIGGAIGLAVLVTVFVNVKENAEAKLANADPGRPNPASLVEGYQAAFMWGAILMVLGLAIYMVALRNSDVESVNVQH